ncbi:uncharacterized protein LOC130612692 [Hydractinia symbiolongicarpus]|uniref:uncharacterized protein LOC130612692 n=1 Tax=Hydractinia symbiolongicarpus TaxID=13093 RepID=UPI00254A9F66|nr:uncharacterized protein LOC130612692 [Hydractinia symbiolongicarpus]
MGCDESKPQYFHLHPEMMYNHTQVLTGEINQRSYPETIEQYCKSLAGLKFHGQKNRKNNDTCTEPTLVKQNNLGYVLSQLDAIIRGSGKTFEVDEESFFEKIHPLAALRKRTMETFEECLSRLEIDGKRFLKIYKCRKVLSGVLTEDKYWGCRQQLLSGKVIADWVDTTAGPMDPIFGVLLNPTAGLVGPGNSFLHQLFFDCDGTFAYHSAVHDGFGYLKLYHDIGPGYDYLSKNWLCDNNMMAGQISGICFWSKFIKEHKKFSLTQTDSNGEDCSRIL